MTEHLEGGGGGATPPQIAAKTGSLLAAMRSEGFRPADAQRALRPGQGGAPLVATFSREPGSGDPGGTSIPEAKPGSLLAFLLAAGFVPASHQEMLDPELNEAHWTMSPQDDQSVSSPEDENDEGTAVEAGFKNSFEG